jgi:prepilin-type N-terminal cleavage/methylation domain-containing protein
MFKPDSDRRSRGFSLLEILMALMVLSISLTGIMSFFAAAQTQSRQADAMTVGTMLARQKIAEVILDLEKKTTEGKFPAEEEQEGKFEGRFALYSWKSNVRKIEFPMPPGQGEEGGGGVPISLFIDQLKLDEAIREVKLTVFWTVRDRERTIEVTTHIIKI